MKNPHLFQSVLVAVCLLVSVSSFSREKLIAHNIKSNDSRGTSLSVSLGMYSSIVGPTIGTQPLGQSVCVGSTVSLSVVATGNGTLSYVWKKDGNLLFDNTGFVVGSRAANLSVINVQGVDAGTYTCEVTDLDGTTVSSNAVIVVNSLPNVTITDPSAVCTPATIDLSASSVTSGSSSNLTYTYWTDSTASSPLSNFNAITSTGSFYIKGTNTNGCFAIAPVTVTVDPAPNVTITNPAAVCSPATVSITSIGVTTGSDANLTYTYFTNASATTVLSNPSAISTSGTYYIKGTNTTTGCFVIKPVSVVINALPNIVITNPTTVCAPATIDLSAASVTTGSSSGLTYTYWRDLAASSTLPNYTSIATSGSYYIKGTNSNSCFSIARVDVTINPEPILVINNPASVCPNTTINLSAAAITSGSSSGLTYTYFTDAVATTPLVNYSTISVAGIYYIKATNTTTGCFTIKPVTVSFNPAPNVVITNPAAVCFPATVSITSIGVTTGSDASLTYTYFTDSAATTVLSNPSAISTSGTYYIKGTNTTTGCFVIKPVVVTINALPSVVITTPAAVCAPATIDLSAASVTVSSSAGLTYTYWRDASATTSLSNYTAVSASGTYYIKGTNANGCSSIQPVTVTVNLEPVLTVVNPAAVCASSTIDLTAPAVSSNSTYSLSYYQDASASQQLVSPEAVSVAGIYYIKATNVTTGCFTIKPVTVSFNPAPNVVITNPAAVCSPATVSITSIGVTTGSDVNLTYTYFTNASTTTVLSNPSAISTSGTYYIKGTNTTTGCFVIKPVVVTINALPSVVITTPAAVCAPATIDLSAASVTVSSSSGLTYTYWRDASATTSLSNYTAVSASGTYYIKGTNANGCSSIQPVTVTVKTLPILNITSPVGVCSPSTIDLTAASVTSGSSSSLTLGYYQDSAAALELANPSFVSVAGIYYIKATNTNGCSVVKPVQARINLPPIIAVNSPIQLCANTTSYTLRNSDIQVIDYSTFSWSYDGFGVLTNSNTLTPTYTPNTADINRGKVTLTLTATFCNLSSTRSVDIQFVPMPTIDIGSAVTICENSTSFVIPDTGGTTGYSTLAWTSTGSAGTLNDTTILTPTYTPSAADIATGSVVLTLRVNSGIPCNTILTATKTVTIQKLPVITTISSAEICENENIYDISGTTITNSYDVNSVRWETSGTGDFIATTRGVNNPSYRPSAADKTNGFVTLTISVTPTGQCSEIQSKSFRLSFIKSPVISAGPDLTQCGERFQIVGSTAVTGTYSSLKWTRTGGTGVFEDDTVPNPFYIPSTSDIQNGLPITLTLTATPISPCVATTASVSSLRLNLVKSPVITVVNQASICEYDTNVTIFGTIIENQSSFVWTSTTGTVISDIHARQPQVTPSLVDINQGFMELTITAQNDVCSLPVSRVVRININRRPILRAGTTRTVCISDGSITPIVSTFDSTVIDAHVTGLPNGLTGVYNVTNKTFTISGTPTAIGTFPYVISSLSSCGDLESGVITVANKTISYKTVNYVQATCQNSPIDPIIFNVYTGISSLTISPSLPSGIVYTMDATTGILTISGTPTTPVPSLQTYTITPVGTFCGLVGDNTFSISVSPEATITFLSDSGSLNQSVCQNAPIVPITFRIGGSATGVNASLLPSGITLSYATSTGIYTIKGNPTQGGIVTIPIATTGCIKTVNATVTKIDSVVSISLISAAGTDSQSICQNNYNSPILPIQYLLTGATGVTVTGLPNGVTSTFDITTGIVSIVGAPIVSGIFNYRIETAPCPIIKNGVLKVSTPISLTNVRISNVKCSDSNDGKIELTIVGGDSSSYAIHWTGPNGFQQNQASITGLYSGDYTISGTDAIGCPIPSNTYTILPVLPVKIVLQSSTNVNCSGSLGCANFSVTGGSGTYNSFVLQFLDPISQTLRTVVPLNNNYFNICNLQAGLYYLTASDTNNCTTSPYPFTIYDYGNLNIDAINLDDSLCANTQGKVRVTVSSLDPNLTFYYNNVIVPHTSVGNNVYELSISNPTIPTGIIKVMNQQNCWDTEPISTTLISPTQLNYTSINLATYGVISVNESVKFTNGLTTSNIPAEYDYIVWDFGDNSPFSVFHNPRDINLNSSGESITTAFHTYALDGLYPVTLTVYNHFGCSRSISKIVTVGQGAKIMLPTAFSPNNDGINDLFRPSLLGLKEVSMYIYDNWGNLIYEVSSDTISLPTDWGWNGIEKVNSEPVNGTYRYYIMAKTINDTIIEKEGQFILIK